MSRLHKVSLDKAAELVANDSRCGQFSDCCKSKVFSLGVEQVEDHRSVRHLHRIMTPPTSPFATWKAFPLNSQLMTEHWALFVTENGKD